MNRQNSEQPPLFRKWRYWYWLVVLVLVIEIALFYIITKKAG
jgi:Mg2+ and Co2+ transporter CorA